MRILAATLAMLLVAACGDSVQYLDEQQEAGGSRGSGGEAAGAPSPHGEPGAGQAPSDPFADPHAGQHPERTQPQDPGKVYLTGRVELAQGYDLPETYTVFVSAYPGSDSRMPLLVQRHARPAFPLEFTLTAADAQFGTPPEGAKLHPGVIVSEQGSVSPSGSGHYNRFVSETGYPQGTEGVVITLEKP